MGDNGDVLIERLPKTSGLRSNKNARNVITKTIGAWLDNYDVSKLIENMFITEAEGGYLDLHGKDYNVPRKLNESDEKYRTRLLYECLGHITSNYIINFYGVELYYGEASFNPTNNVMLSDNPHFNNYNLIIRCSSEMKNILLNKLVLGSDVEWVIV